MRWYIVQLSFFALSLQGVSALSVSEAIEHALLNSPDWQQKSFSYQAQTMNPRIALASNLPSLSTRLQQTSGISYDAYDINGNALAPLSMQQSQIITELSIPLYKPSALAAYDSAYHQSLVDKLLYQSQKEQFMSDVLKKYFDVLLQAKNSTLSERFLSRREQLYQDTREKYHVGLVSLSDLKAAEAFRDQAVARKIQAHFLLTSAQEQLKNILIDFPERFSDADVDIDFNYPVDFKPQRTHYLLEIAEELVQRASSELNRSMSALYPEITSSTSYSHLPFNQNLNRSVSQISSSIALSWAPVQGGGATAAIQQARYSQQAAKSNQMQVARNYATLSVLAQKRLQTSIAQLQAEREGLSSNKIYLSTVEASYDAGQATITDVLHAQEAVTEQEMRVFKEIYDCLIEYFELGLLMSYDHASLLSSIDSFLNQEWVVPEESQQT